MTCFGQEKAIERALCYLKPSNPWALCVSVLCPFLRFVNRHRLLVGGAIPSQLSEVQSDQLTYSGVHRTGTQLRPEMTG